MSALRQSGIQYQRQWSMAFRLSSFCTGTLIQGLDRQFIWSLVRFYLRCSNTPPPNRYLDTLSSERMSGRNSPPSNDGSRFARCVWHQCCIYQETARIGVHPYILATFRKQHVTSLLV